jgi:uncharacterized Fe-S cluster-containing radical SAM superfamily enzyme
MILKVEKGIPLIGCIAFGVIDRGTNLLQVRPTSVCNLNCPFCSVDSGIHSKFHKVNYEVDCDYLLDEVKKVVEYKDEEVEINLDSVGEVLCYFKIEELVQGLRKIKNVKKISMQTNGLLYKKLDVDIVNFSLHAMDEDLAKKLAGVECYNVKNVLENIKKYLKTCKVRLCPVWIPNVNDNEIPKIIQFAKENNCELGIQKYETYSYSRQMKGVKPLTWWKFYHQLEKWEKEFGVKLKLTAKDVEIKKAKRIPEVFKKGEKVKLVVVCKGWVDGQMIGVGRERCVSINHCDKDIGDQVNAKILETKNNIYLAE